MREILYECIQDQITIITSRLMGLNELVIYCHVPNLVDYLKVRNFALRVYYCNVLVGKALR